MTDFQQQQPMAAPVQDDFMNKHSGQIWTTAIILLMVSFLVMTSVGLYVFKRNETLRNKIRHLLTGVYDQYYHPSKANPASADPADDYQDLCRQRQQEKSKEEVTEGPFGPSTSGKQAARSSSSSDRSSTSSWTNDATVVTMNMDISTGHMILTYMEDHLKNKDRLEKEWANLCKYEPDVISTTIGSKPENKKKNRFPEILPYDDSRLILNPSLNSNKSDYINASTIIDHDPRNPAYIATQGPLANTTGDFWQMVWEKGSNTILMLTRLMESGTSLCHRYWPEEGSSHHGNFEVTLVSEHIWSEDFLMRTLYLKHLKTKEIRTVTQFHFLSWPEKSVPSTAKAILDFRRKVNKNSKTGGRGNSTGSASASPPIIVHCSDGVGRTGTYCLIDMVLNRMSKGAKEIDIAATLEHLRDQRMGMVKTRGQFEYVLKAVALEVQNILRTLQGTSQAAVVSGPSTATH